MDLTRLHSRLSPGGPPVALPALLDRASERWWRLPPRVRAGLLAVLVLLALAVVGRGATRSPWGPPTPVLVAATDLGPGDPVGADAVRVVTRPARSVPPDALTRADQVPADARARGTAPAGAVLTRRHLAAGLAELVGPDHAAVPVPRDGQPTLQTGQRVDAIVTTAQGTGTRVATGTRVLALDAGWTWLAVPADRVDDVAGAASSGRLVLAVRSRTGTHAATTPARPRPT